MVRMKHAAHDDVASAMGVRLEFAHTESGPANCESHEGIPRVSQQEGLMVVVGLVQSTACCGWSCWVWQSETRRSAGMRRDVIGESLLICRSRFGVIG